MLMAALLLLNRPMQTKTLKQIDKNSQVFYVFQFTKCIGWNVGEFVVAQVSVIKRTKK